MNPNEYDINAYTTNDIDAIDIASGNINIDSYYEKPWQDTIARTISTSDGDISITDIVILGGNPTTSVYYARYTDDDGNEITEPAQVTSEGDPTGLVCSGGTKCLDIANGKLYVQIQQGDPTAWEYVCDAEVLQLVRLRYEDIDTSKYYWDSAEQALYKFNIDKNLWSTVAYDLYAVNGDPTTEITEPDSSYYYYDTTGGNAYLMYYDKYSKEWEQIREVELVAGLPADTYTELYDIDQEKYYIDTESNILYTFNHPWTLLSYSLHGTNGDPRNLGTSTILIDSSLYYYNYNETETTLYLFDENNLVWNKIKDIVINTENPAKIYTNINEIEMEKLYYWVSELKDDTDGKIYQYNHTVFLERVTVDEEVYECICDFFQRLMDIWVDINDSDRLKNKTFIFVDRYPAYDYPYPDTDRIYVDTTTGEFYEPLEDGLIKVDNPYTIEEIDVDSVEELEMEEGIYYINMNTNRCYALIDGLKQEVKLPALPIDLSTVETCEYNRYYTDGSSYYLYDPYKKLTSANELMYHDLFIW